MEICLNLFLKLCFFLWVFFSRSWHLMLVIVCWNAHFLKMILYATTSALAAPWMLGLSLYILNFFLGARCSYNLFILKFLSTHKAIFPSTSFFLLVCEFSEDKGLKQWSRGTHFPNSPLLIIQLLNSICIWKVTLANVSYSLSLPFKCVTHFLYHSWFTIWPSLVTAHLSHSAFSQHIKLLWPWESHFEVRQFYL